MNDTITRSTIVRNAHALNKILEHAESIGLPIPHFADIDSTEEVVSLGLSSLEDLTDWSRWMEAEIQSEDFFGATSFKVVGRALEYPVECWYSTGVVHPSQRTAVSA